jgi:hypothetical protein
MRVREMQTRVEGNRLIVSNTDDLGGGGYERGVQTTTFPSL